MALIAPMTTSTLHAEVIADRDAVMQITADWHELFVGSRCNCPFLSAEWMLGWFDQYGAGRSLFVIAVRDDDGRLVALAPLSIEDRGVGGLARRLCFIGDRWVSSDHLSILTVPGMEAAAAECVMTAIAAGSGKWDYLELTDCDAAAVVMDRLSEMTPTAATSASWRTKAVCPHITLPDRFDTYFAGLGSNLRSKLRRLGRRLSERGTVEWSEYTSGPDLFVAYDTLVRLHGLRFTDRGDRSAFLDPRAQQFHQAVLGRLADRGWVRLFHLSVDNRPIAALLAFHVQDKFLFFQAGMDPAWSEMRPGQLLMSRTIERAIELGCSDYDFLRGAEAYKQMWSSESRHTRTLTAYGQGWRATAARVAHAGRRHAARFVARPPVRVAAPPQDEPA
jgi:CelD/BcsL family acetyltransferase involved in cellulose biosynthesis